jgi:hypothetical protein
MIDITELPATPTVADFDFKVGNDHDPAGWFDAPAPTSTTVRGGEGTDGSDRVTIIWADNAIQKCWLQVTVKATANTGLAADDAFCFGNAIGDVGDSTTHTIVNAFDMLGMRQNARNSENLAPVTDAYDIDRNRLVNAFDMLEARRNATNSETMLVLLDLTGGVPGSVAGEGVMMQNARARFAGTRQSSSSEEKAGTAETQSINLDALAAFGIDNPMTMHRTKIGAIVLEFTVPEGAVLQSSEDIRAWTTVDVETDPSAWRNEGDSKKIMVKATRGASRFFRVMAH